MAGASAGAGLSETVRDELALRAWSRKSQMVCISVLRPNSRLLGNEKRVNYALTGPPGERSLTTVSRSDRKRVSTSDPVVSKVGTTSVGTVPVHQHCLLAPLVSLGGAHTIHVDSARQLVHESSMISVRQSEAHFK